MAKQIRLFALSTCIHCKNTKQYLDDCGVKYDCVFVDTLTGEERAKTIEEVKQYNPKMSFPTIVIGDKIIVGFNKSEITEAINKP